MHNWHRQFLGANSDAARGERARDQRILHQQSALDVHSHAIASTWGSPFDCAADAMSLDMPEYIWYTSPDPKRQVSGAATSDLRVPPGNQLEALKGDRKVQYSIRVNRQWRVCFLWKDGEALDVEIVDYH
jgi:proteic killer suppression protein